MIRIKIMYVIVLFLLIFSGIDPNVSLLELVAAYGKLFFHNRPSEVMKSKRTTYRKTSHEL
jgi:hypothetical protein